MGSSGGSLEVDVQGSGGVGVCEFQGVVLVV